MNDFDHIVLEAPLGVTERGTLWQASRVKPGDRIIRRMDPRYCDAPFLQALAMLRDHPLRQVVPIVGEGWIEDTYCLEYALPGQWQLLKNYQADLHWRQRLYTVYQVVEAIQEWMKSPVHPLGLHLSSLVMVAQGDVMAPWLLACPPMACTSPLDFWDVDAGVLACLPPEQVRGVYSDSRLQDGYALGALAALALAENDGEDQPLTREEMIENHVRGRMAPAPALEGGQVEAFLQDYPPLQELAGCIRRYTLASPSSRPINLQELRGAIIQALNKTEAVELAKAQLERDSDTDLVFEMLDWGFLTGSDSVQARSFGADLALHAGDLDRAIEYMDQAALLAPGSLEIRRKCCDLRLVRMFASPEIPAGQPDPEGDILLGELEWLLGATFDQTGQRELVVKTAQVYLHRQDLARAAKMLYLAVEQGPSDLNALYLYAKCLVKMGATDSARQAAAIAHDRIDKMVKSEMLAERKGHEWHEKFKNF